MMKCLDEETIEALASGTLEGQARSDAVAHVRQCPGCRETVRETAALYRAIGPVFASETRDNCPTGEELALYDDGAAEPALRKRVEEHLKACIRCAADLYELRTEREAFLAAQREPAQQRQPAAVAQAVHAVFAAGARIASIQRLMERAARGVCEFLEEILLACFRPRAAQVALLAAATGPGFHRQSLSLPDSPFDVEMTQFGEEVRVSLNAKPGTGAEYADCLVRFILAEGQAVKMTRLVLVHGGRGTCALPASEVAACVPDNHPLSASIELVNVSQVFEGLKAPDTVTALIGLLGHTDPSVRRAAVEVLALP